MQSNNSTNPPESIHLDTRGVIAGLLVILAVILAFLLLYQFRTMAILVFTGVVISTAMAPAVDWLHRRKVPRSISVILIYLGLLGLILGFMFLVIPQSISQATDLFPRLEDMYASVKASLQGSPYPFLHAWASSLPATLSSILPITGGGSGGGLKPLTLTLTIAQGLLDTLFTLSAVLLLAFYWTLEGERIGYALLLLLPFEKREGIREILTEVEARVGGFVRGQGLLALAVGLMVLAAYLLIGLPTVLSLAFLAGVFELVPLFGPILGAIPALLVAVISSPAKVLWVILATIAIQSLENHLLAPRIMQKTVGVNPIVTILSITGFGSLFGFPGLLMAIPLAAIFQVILDRSVLRPAASDPRPPEGRDRLSKLRYEAQEYLQDVRKLRLREAAAPIGVDGDEIEDDIESIAADLDGLLAQSNHTELVP